jgi:tetratricopeptide (TPR) repeat protein
MSLKVKFPLLAFIIPCYLAAASGAHAGRVELADARTAALGGGPAIDSGFYALGTNPAVLYGLTHMQFTFDHRIYPTPNAARETVGAAFPLGSYGTVAGGFGTVRVGGIEHYSPGNEPLGEYVYHDDLITAGYGVGVTRWLAVGGAFNYGRSLTSPDNVFTSVGADAGAYFRPLGAESSLENTVGTVALALNIQNIFATQREVYTGDYREPARLSLGALWGRELGRYRLGLTLGVPTYEPELTGLGCEFVLAETVAGRVGVSGSHPSAGVGVSTNLFSFDYCYATRENGASHYFTVSVNPGRDIHGRGERRRQTEKWLAEGRSYFEAGNYELAAERFANALEWDPRNDIARQYWIRAKYHMYMAEGAAYVSQGNWDEARRAYRGALVVVPDDFLAQESLGRVDQLEEQEKARLAEEQRIADLLAQAEDYRRRGAYRQAINVCEEILADHPDHAEARKLANQARALLAAATSKTVEPVKAPEITPEAIEQYREASRAFSRGAVGEAVRSLEDVVMRYPDYAPARAKLVEAYLYQGLDFYSKGSLAAAVRVWGRGLALDPGNEKLTRYIRKAEVEIDQIR